MNLLTLFLARKAQRGISSPKDGKSCRKFLKNNNDGQKARQGMTSVGMSSMAQRSASIRVSPNQKTHHNEVNFVIVHSKLHHFILSKSSVPS